MGSPKVSASHWRQVAARGCNAGVIGINPNILHGAAEFPGTRVPVRFLLDELQGGGSLDSFKEGFPDVSREQAQAVLELAFASAIGPRDAQNPVR